MRASTLPGLLYSRQLGIERNEPELFDYLVHSQADPSYVALVSHFVA
jgi:hypothetical protein